MAGSLPAIGQVTYNDYTFSNTLNARLTSRAVLDDSGRYMKYIAYNLFVHDIVYADVNIDTAVEIVRNRLSAPGKVLVIDSQGMGSIEVNRNSSYDVNWGPIPQPLDWTPAGSNRCAHIEWSCDFFLSHCSSPVYNSGLQAYGYTSDISVDELGYTSRVINGYIEIANRRISEIDARRILSSAGAKKFINKVVVNLPNGFKRSAISVRTSENKSRADFSFSDEQIKSRNPYPKGAVEIDVEQDIDSSLAGSGFAQWRSSISGTVTVRQGVPPSAAWAAFLVSFNARLAKMLQGGPVGKSAWIDSISISEGIYGLPSRFGIGLRFMSNLQNFLATSGLWTPVTGDWSTWKEDLLKTIWKPGGYLQMDTSPDDDALIDLCTSRTPPAIGAALSAPQSSPGVYGIPYISNPLPSPTASWMSYNLSLTTYSEGRVLVHRPLMQQPLKETYADLGAGLNIESVKGINFPSNNDSAARFQSMGSPTYFVELSGWAVRGNYPIGIPRIEKLGERDATELRCVSKQIQVGDVGFPIYAAAWSVVYGLDDAPKGDLKYPPNFTTPQKEYSAGDQFTGQS